VELLDVKCCLACVLQAFIYETEVGGGPEPPETNDERLFAIAFCLVRQEPSFPAFFTLI